jgi:phosphorylcholine metabolism protein LicD
MLQLIENVLPINYSLAFGSLLGYARHQKFIPYDDDIDIIIDREDLKTFEKTLPILKQHMNVYKYKKPIFNNTLYYKLYPKDDSVSIKIDGYPYRYPFIDVFVYDKVYVKNILYKEATKKVLYIDNKVFEMNEDTELVDLGSHSVKGFTIKTRVFKDRTIFLDKTYPNWEEMCISSTWNHRLEKPTKYRGQFFCKNILF